MSAFRRTVDARLLDQEPRDGVAHPSWLLAIESTELVNGSHRRRRTASPWLDVVTQVNSLIRSTGLRFAEQIDRPAQAVTPPGQVQSARAGDLILHICDVRVLWIVSCEVCSRQPR